MKEKHLAALIGLASLMAVIGLWEYASDHRLANPALLPPPSAVASALVALIADGDIWQQLLHTAALFAGSYLIACTLGIAIGVWMGCSEFANGLLEPLVESLRPIPKSALVPALFLFLGIGPLTMVTVVVFAAVFPVLINVYQGVRGMDPVLGETARTFGCSRWRTIRSVVLPATLPAIFTGMKVALSLGIVLAVLAEMLAGQSGLGFIILDTQRAFQTDQMYAWVVVLAAFGAACSLLFDRIERLAIPWHGR
jgi:ABC-type nitrate/sulfonate/bicarbonate transport system permease component